MGSVPVEVVNEQEVVVSELVAVVVRGLVVAGIELVGEEILYSLF